MTLVDPIGDMITRIRNAQMRLLNNVKIPNSKLVILSNYKHSLLLEAPEKVVENIINFFLE